MLHRLLLNRRTPSALRRHVHTRRQLPYNIDHGLGRFMTPQTLRMVAVEYQDGLLHRLNQECRSVDDQRKTVAQLVLDTARSQDRALVFKYASHALNNSFFLHSLRPPPENADDDTDAQRIAASFFGTAVQKQFGGFDALRALFSAAVDGMAGSGYVWFVTDAKRNLAFLPTFASGTLLIRSGAGVVEPVTAPVLGEGEAPIAPTTPTSTPTPTLPFARPPHDTPTRMFHTSVSSHSSYRTRARSFYDPAAPTQSPLGPQDPRDFATLGEYIYPLFCISVHEHCWLLDHGIWGKENYLKEFWTVVNWDQVVKRFETFTATKI